jgi:hypothetical protein
MVMDDKSVVRPAPLGGPEFPEEAFRDRNDAPALILAHLTGAKVDQLALQIHMGPPER